MVTNVDGSVLNTMIIAEPDELREQSEKVRQNANVMRTIWQEITHLVNTTNTYWNGEAAEHFRNAFNNYTDVIESMAKYSLQGTTQGNGLTGGVPPVRFSM